MLEIILSAIALLLMYKVLIITIKAITKETEKQNKDDQQNDGLLPVQALHCLESFNYSNNDLNILADCIKTLDNSELNELSGYNLKYTKDKETKKIEFKKV